MWIGIGTLAGTGGFAAVIGAWQKLPDPTIAQPHPSVWESSATWIPFIAGGILILLALYIFAAFFFPRLPLPYPHTREESIPPTATTGPMVERGSDGTWRATGKPEESTKEVAEALTVVNGSSELKGNPDDEPGQEG